MGEQRPTGDYSHGRVRQATTELQEQLSPGWEVVVVSSHLIGLKGHSGDRQVKQGACLDFPLRELVADVKLSSVKALLFTDY